MFRTAEFEAFVAPAKDYPQIWRILLGVITSAVVYIGPIIVLGVSAGLLFPERVNEIESVLLGAPTPTAMLILLSTFFFMGLGAVAAAGVHRRGMASLIGPFRPACRNFSRAVIACVLVYPAIGWLSGFIYPDELTQNMVFSRWLSLLPLALPLLFIQIGAEELLFRGYLMQALAARFRSALIWFVIPSLLFGAMHYNPDIDPNLALATVGATTVFGLVAADLTRITGNLGAAIGFHLANNFAALFLVSIADELSGLALYHSSYTMNDVAVLLPLTGVSVITILTVWWLLRRWLDPNRL
ncbi:MAG: type II CAAX endopeptidase family protein [Pseudomonadota bacterium]